MMKKYLITVILSAMAILPSVAFAQEDPGFKVISLQDGAKSLLFLNEGENILNYVKHKDFIGYGAASISDETAYPAHAITISESNMANKILKTTNGIWTVETVFADKTTTVPYEIKRENKVIKLCGFNNNSIITDPLVKDWMKGSLTSVCDIENDAYSKINLLTLYPDGTNSDLKVTVYYEDGTSFVVQKTLTNMPYLGTDQKNGYIIARPTSDYSTNASGYRFTTVEIPVNPVKVTDKIEFTAMGKTWRHTYIAAATGERTNVSSLIDNLPLAGEVTSQTYESIKNSYDSIFSIMSFKGIALADLSAEHRTKLSSVKYALEGILYEMSKTIPLNIQNGANSLLFLNQGTFVTNHIRFRDFLPKNYMSSTLTDSYVYVAGGIRLALSGVSGADLVCAPNNLWNINGINYFVEENSRSVKLYKAGTVQLSNADDVKEINKLNNITVDLENGLYSKLYLLAANPHGNTNTAADRMASVDYTLTYTDGSAVSGTLSIDFNPFDDKYSPEFGYVKTVNIFDGTSVSTVKFADYQIEIDKTKQIDKIKFTLNTKGRNVLIAAISGESAKIREVKAKIEDCLTFDDSRITTDLKPVLYNIDDLVKEFTALGGDISGINNIGKFTNAFVTYKQKVLCVTSSSFDTDFEKIYARLRFSNNVKNNGGITVKANGETLSNYTVSAVDNSITIALPNDSHATKKYEVSLSTGIVNADDNNFYLDPVYSFSFTPLKPVSIESFTAGKMAAIAVVKNNMTEKSQKYSVLILIYSQSKKLVYSKIQSGNITPNGEITISGSPNLPSGAYTASLYLVDDFVNLKYLDETSDILIE